MFKKEIIEKQIRNKSEVTFINCQEKISGMCKKGGKDSACVGILGFRHYMCLFIYVFVCLKIIIIIIFYHTR